MATADHDYFLWQALVQAVELHRLGINATYLVYTQRAEPSKHLRSLMHSGLADFHVWQDWRTRKDYNPVMKPAQIARWLTENPAEADCPFALLDPDAIPTRPISVGVTPTQWKGTDTDSYTGPGYLRSKPGVWEGLCGLVGVDPAVADRPGVGAQVVVVGQPAEFWQRVADVSVEAFRWMGRSGTDVQTWCAEMYVTALEAARRGIELTADPSLSMVWANGPADGWGTDGFFHAAGVTEANGEDFFKCEHQVSPWGKPITVSATSASARYVELIHQAERLRPDLVWRSR